MPIEVVDVESMHRYELLEDGELLGYLSYADRRVEQSDDAEVPGAESRGADACGSDDNGASGDERLLVRDLQHTVIDPEQRGRGLGSVLVPAVLDDIRELAGEARAEAKAEPKAEPKSEPKSEPKAERKAEPKADAKPNGNAAGK